MCGIAGWVGLGRREELASMVQALHHRGPDESGLWLGDHAALGIARLAIIDVSGGHQPVTSQDGAVVAVGNGEIYNFRDLARSLARAGFSLHSASDMEVVPHLYQRYGLAFVEHLRGMFAIALWDQKLNRLVLARDRVGKKPLFYSNVGDRLLFGSEARALLATGWKPDADLSALNHLLAFAQMPNGAGAFNGLTSVLPGHICVWERGTMTTSKYWRWEPDDGSLAVSQDDALDAVRDKLEEAVKIRLVSERPIGAFLSGGIDSTLVTALMSRNQTGKVKTFSIGFAESKYDESQYARQVAHYLDTDHTELIVTPDPDQMLNQLQDTFDQPFADSSAIPTMILSELAARDVVVALSGDGGDEGFGGYDRYVAAPVLQKLNPLLGIGAHLVPQFQKIPAVRRSRKLKRVSQEMGPQPNLGARYLQMMQYIPVSLRKELWTLDAVGSLDLDTPEKTLFDLWQTSVSQNALDQMRFLDMQTYLPNDLLAKVDTCSMAHSLEVRSPLLDHEVLELAASIPQRMLIRGTRSKLILRELASQYVPRHLIDRPKMGFGIPRSEWLRGPLYEHVRDLLLDHTARDRGWFRPEVVTRLLHEHKNGLDRDLYLWPLIVLELWARRWLDSN